MKAIILTLAAFLCTNGLASQCQDTILDAQSETIMALAKGDIEAAHAAMIFNLQELALETCNPSSEKNSTSCQSSRNDLASAAGLTALARHQGRISRRQANMIKDMQQTARYTLELYCSK